MTIDAMFLGPTDLFEFWASGTLSSSKERNPLLPKLATAILNSDKLVGDRLSGDDFPVRKLVGEQRQAQLVRMRQMIEGGGLEQSGPNRLENGKQAGLKTYSRGTLKTLVPRAFFLSILGKIKSSASMMSFTRRKVTDSSPPSWPC